MLKQGVALSLFCALMLFQAIQSAESPLFYFSFSILLIFLMLYLYFAKRRFMLQAALGIFIAFYAYFFFRHPAPELLFLGIVQAGLAWTIVLYRKEWKKLVAEGDRERELARREWEVLSQKHMTRVESLRNLEKQTSSLMDLFEIARDFTDCLDLNSLVELLHQRVMPDLPFRAMRFILCPCGEFSADAAERKFYVIRENGVSQLENKEPDAKEKEMMDAAAGSEQLVREGDLWVFPMRIEGKCIVFMNVEGAHDSDLVKFEVLAAHLLLQIKKINLYETVKELSIVDGLTQVFVRRHFTELFEAELKRCLKHRLSLSLLMLDIDHFKRYNDEFGHLVGDATLREVASFIRSQLRKVDIVGRYGGEEFVIMLPETEDAGAMDVAERIRSGIAHHGFQLYDVTTRVTVSLGVAIFPDDAPGNGHPSQDSALAEQLMSRSDRAMYRAKEDGRNRVIRYREF